MMTACADSKTQSIGITVGEDIGLDINNKI
jgi:hypothetical protein